MIAIEQQSKKFAISSFRRIEFRRYCGGLYVEETTAVALALKKDVHEIMAGLPPETKVSLECNRNGLYASINLPYEPATPSIADSIIERAKKLGYTEGKYA